MTIPRTAIVAVHGVGDHKPGDTSTGLAHQLQYFFPTQFDVFTCTPLQIAVDTTELNIPHVAPATDAIAPKVRLPSSVGSRAIAYSAAAPDPQVSADVQFTSMCLQKGGDYKDSYSTTLMRSKRRQPGGGPELPFDLYEMYWADVAHGGVRSGFSVLTQLMQLFLHVASLGRSALATLLAFPPKGLDRLPALRTLYRASARGYWLLAVPILLGNLLMLVLGLAFLTQLVPTSPSGRAGTAIAGALALSAILGTALSVRMRETNRPSWTERYGLACIWGIAVVVATLGAWLEWETRVAPSKVAFAIASLPLLVLSTHLVRRYDVSRPGASRWWRRLLWLFAAWALFSIVDVMAKGYQPALLTWYVYLVEGCFGFLVLAWLALYLNNFVLLVAALISKKSTNEQARLSVDTSLIAATIPAPLLLTVVLVCWAGFWNMFSGPRFPVMAMKVHSLYHPDLRETSSRIHEFIDLSASPAAIPFLICLAVAFLCALIGVFPSVLAEVAPPDTPADPGKARALWEWLNQGFRILHIAKWICLGGFVFLLPIGATVQYLSDETTKKLPFLAITVGAGTLAFLSITKALSLISLGRVSRFFASIRVFVDVAIDVDTWLRERPEGETPRLRIMARYVSLLRHLAHQRYDRIVLVCHSQGSVITLDLLRYLDVYNRKLIEALGRIDLLTLGCPLRQLYAARFPAIYDWAINPSLEGTGLASWNNGYGSGDYVGRNLWDPTPSSWATGRVAGQTDFCVGALAHTRYFDECSPDVAAEVDRLLAAARTRN
jgi:hypothetical protein